MVTSYLFRLLPDKSWRASPEAAYRLYSAMLDNMPPEFGAAFHEDGVTPISQFVTVQGGAPFWKVSLIGETAEAFVGAYLERMAELYVERDGATVGLRLEDVQSIEDEEELFSLGASCGGVHTLRFCTPAAFKSHGEYVILPTPRLIVQSLIKKWNGSIYSRPIADKDDIILNLLSSGLRCTGYELKSRPFRIKGCTLPGFTGTITLENCLAGEEGELADALMAFAEFSGVGIKTTLGMGGILREARP